MEMKVSPLMEVLAIGTQTTLRWRDPRKEVAASHLHNEKSPSAEKCRRKEEDSIAGRHGPMESRNFWDYLPQLAFYLELSGPHLVADSEGYLENPYPNEPFKVS